MTRRWTAKAGPTEGWQGDRGLPCSGSQCLRQGLRRSPWQGLDKEHGPRETEDVLGGPGRLCREDSRGAGAETLTPSLPPTGGGRTIGLELEEASRAVHLRHLKRVAGSLRGPRRDTAAGALRASTRSLPTAAGPTRQGRLWPAAPHTALHAPSTCRVCGTRLFFAPVSRPGN